MPNDARMLVHCAVPTAVGGVVGAVVSGLLTGGKGAIGAVAGAVVVILFMGGGLAGLQKTAKSYPHLFQAMGLLLYTTQILLLAVLLIAFKGTTLFDGRAFAFTLLGSTLLWIASQAVAHKKAKILYVEPESTTSGSESKTAGTGARS